MATRLPAFFFIGEITLALDEEEGFTLDEEAGVFFCLLQPALRANLPGGVLKPEGDRDDANVFFKVEAEEVFETEPGELPPKPVLLPGSDPDEKVVADLRTKRFGVHGAGLEGSERGEHGSAFIEEGPALMMMANANMAEWGVFSHRSTGKRAKCLQYPAIPTMTSKQGPCDILTFYCILPETKPGTLQHQYGRKHQHWHLSFTVSSCVFSIF